MDRYIALTDREAALGDKLRAIVRPRWNDLYKSPFGASGDVLHGRETHALVHPIQIRECRESKETGAGIPGPPEVGYRLVYKADGDVPPIWLVREHPFRSLDCPSETDKKFFPQGVEPVYWYSPVVMPRDAIRRHCRVLTSRACMAKDIKAGILLDTVGHSWQKFYEKYSENMWLWYAELETINA